MVEFKKGNTVGKKKQFQPGQSGNPKGMKKGTKHFKTIVRELAVKNVYCKNLQKEKETMSAAEGVVTSLYVRAIFGGDVSAARILMEHEDGKTIAIEGGDEDKPLLTEIIYRIVDDTCPQERDGYLETKADGERDTHS